MPKPVIYQVGGCVRDRLLNLPEKDIDFVVVGATVDYMARQGFTRVGADFPVFIHPQSGDEYSMARKERSTGDGYGDFECLADSSITLDEDLYRRDLTINAIAFHPKTGVYHDPYGGMRDIESKIIRHVSSHFSEDPLRVLRVARFAARYAHLGFTVHESTISLMKEIADKNMLASLKPERIYKELSRAIIEPSPHVFFTTLDRANCLKSLFPEIYTLKGQTQPEKHHPEVDTFIHQMLVLKQAIKMTDDTETMFAALCHDFGKGLTPAHKLPHHHGHEKSGIPVIEAFMSRLKAPKDVTKLATLTSEFHTHIHRAKEMTAKSFLRLLKNFDVFRSGEASFMKFLVACEADARGREGLEDNNYPQADIARKVLYAAKAATWDKEILMEIKPSERSSYIDNERLDRIKHAINIYHDNARYRQYREQYVNFDKISSSERLGVLLRDKAQYHSNYVEQTMAIALLSEETKKNIREAASSLQMIESKYKLKSKNSELKVKKRKAMLNAINSIY